MTTEGNEGKQIYKEQPQTWPERYLIRRIEEESIIHDGRVTIVIPELELVVIAKVKGTKGHGTADADNLKVPSEAHVEILQVLQKYNGIFTTDTLMDLVDGARATKQDIFVHQMPKGSLVDRNGIRRPISELLRKGVIMSVYGTKNQYAADHKRVDEILKSRSF